MLDKKKIFSRQEMMFSNKLRKSIVTILWTWFVGSNLLYTFIRSGFLNFNLVDFDIVKEHNLLSQYFKSKNINLLKVDALVQNIEEDFPKEITEELSIFSFWGDIKDFFSGIKTEDFWENNIYVISVDSIKGRIDFLEEKIKFFNERDIYIFVNTSSDIAYIGIFKGNKKVLEKMLKEYKGKKEEDYEQGVCWEKNSFYIWNLISGLVLGELRNTSQNNKEKISKEFWIDLKENLIDTKFKWFLET